jgi:hypothetical protein
MQHNAHELAQCCVSSSSSSSEMAVLKYQQGQDVYYLLAAPAGYLRF